MQRAHSAEIKGMLNPQPPSKESLKEKGKPTRERKQIDKLYAKFTINKIIDDFLNWYAKSELTLQSEE